MAKILKAPGKYIQGAGEVKNIGKIIKNMGTNFLVLMSKRSKSEIWEIIYSSITEAGYKCICEIFNGECTLEEISRLVEIGKTNNCNSVISFGGGKIIDTGTAVAVGLDSTSIVIPTIASNDAPCSGLSVVYNDKGEVVKVIFGKRNPDLVIVDPDLLIKSPKKYLIAGMGDALSTYFEARACKESKAKNMGRGTATSIALQMGKLCYELLLANGEKALEEFENGIVGEAIENILEANILLSGIGFESGGLAAAHAINDGFSQSQQAHKALHGEKVAYGTLCQLILEKVSEKDYDEVFNFCKSIGLPTKLSDLGIVKINPEEIKNIAAAACAPTQSTKNMPFAVSIDDVENAIYKVNEIGESRK
ncbi:glycerol dehydrogenase [Fusobacterium sp. PH5-44]|uniref:glycerol dehydrogenase n=1 Tax=unclassified Fusobacterium TaxID=2648384 RepID=UPI003D19C312